MAKKKARTEVLAPISGNFKAQVKTLADEARDIAKSYGGLTQRMLKLAEKIKSLSEQAKKLDVEDDGGHQRLLHDAIADAVGTTDKSVLSKYITIGSQAKMLLTYKNDLPHQRDGLYEVALAVKDRKPIGKWIDAGDLTNETSVRNVRALRNPTKKPAKKKPRKKNNAASVTMFFGSYADAIAVLKDVMLSKASFTVQSAQAFSEALRAEIQDASYDTTIKPRFA